MLVSLALSMDGKRVTCGEDMTESREIEPKAASPQSQGQLACHVWRGHLVHLFAIGGGSTSGEAHFQGGSTQAQLAVLLFFNSRAMLGENPLHFTCTAISQVATG